MTLSPEERRKIYEEEKARIEAREQLGRQRKPSPESTTGLSPNVAGLLCYLGAWITGIIFLVLEKKNRWVRFHAAQSLVTFGALSLAGAVIGWIPFIGWFFSAVFGIIGFILWIVLMVKAYNGEYYHLIIAGDIAESIVNSYTPPSDYQSARGTQPPPPPPAASSSEGSSKSEPPPSPPPISPAFPTERFGRRAEDFFERRRAGRITAYAFAIAWSIALLVFFNFYWQYVAYYHGVTRGGTVILERYPLFTSEIHRWLPILTATLIISIVGHVILILYDKYTLRQVVRLITSVFGLATVVTLLTVFPFDFSVIPDSGAATGTQIGVIIVLALIAVGYGVSIIVHFIKLVINLVTGRADYHKAI